MHLPRSVSIHHHGEVRATNQPYTSFCLLLFWKRLRMDFKFPSKLISNRDTTIANTCFLNTEPNACKGQSKDFQAYIDAIAKKTDGGVGHFSEVRKHQFEVLRRGKDGNAQTKTDETPVNSSFIILLRALESVVPDCKYWWRSSKVRFSVTFTKEGVKRD